MVLPVGGFLLSGWVTGIVVGGVVGGGDTDTDDDELLALVVLGELLLLLLLLLLPPHPATANEALAQRTTSNHRNRVIGPLLHSRA